MVRLAQLLGATALLSTSVFAGEPPLDFLTRRPTSDALALPQPLLSGETTTRAINGTTSNPQSMIRIAMTKAATGSPATMTNTSTTMTRSTMTRRTSTRTPNTALANKSGASPTRTVCLVSCYMSVGAPALTFFPHPECVAQYGAPPKEWKPADIPPPAAQGTGVVHTVMVAPMMGVLRYWPFSVNASVGDTIRYIWTTPANHTATLSSALAPCNRSARAEELQWASGVRNASEAPSTCEDLHALLFLTGYGYSLRTLLQST